MCGREFDGEGDGWRSLWRLREREMEEVGEGDG